jgi:photosystem II stability/assembly factor-like uncharacterized protein
MTRFVLPVALAMVLSTACRAGEVAGGPSTALPSGLSLRVEDRVEDRAEGWRLMPIRSEQEFKEGRIGGEATQHPHSIARCLSNPDVIYISHDCCQVWRSTDAGRTWRKSLCKGMWVSAGHSVEVDPVMPEVVLVAMAAGSNYLAKDCQGVYRSADGGESWQLVLARAVVAPRMHQHALAYDLTSVTAAGAQRWYAGLAGDGLYRSEDGGETWALAASLEGNRQVLSVQVHPSDGRTVYVASGEGLLVSRERGANLTPLGNLPAGSVSSVAVNALDPMVLYAVLQGKGLYRSADGGSTFLPLKEHDALHVFLNPHHPEVVFLSGMRTDSLVSHDGGATWQPVRGVPAPGLDRDYRSRFRGGQTGFAPNPNDPNEAVAYSQSALWKSTDGGVTFQDSSSLFSGYAWGWWAHGVGFDAADPNRFGLFCCDISMAMTENGGTWFDRRANGLWEAYSQRLISWPGMYAGDIQPIPGSQVIVASVGMYFDTKLVRTEDAGRNWQIVDNDPENHLFVAFHPGEPNLVFSGRKRSLDAGRTWQTVEFLVPYNASILGMCAGRPDTIYALSRPRRHILRSDDRGESWRVYAQTDWDLNRHDSKPTFAVHPRDPDKVYTLDARGDLAMFDGKTWTSLGVLPLAGGAQLGNFVRGVAVDPRHPEVIYAGTFASGLSCVFRSVDAGRTWEDVTRNLPRAGADGILVHPLTGDLMYGGAFGTWFLPPPYESPNSFWPRMVAVK